MPIRSEHRFFYPIDWPQLSDAIRFRWARGQPDLQTNDSLGLVSSPTLRPCPPETFENTIYRKRCSFTRWNKRNP